jgi:hypothetical protein
VSKISNSPHTGLGFNIQAQRPSIVRSPIALHCHRANCSLAPRNFTRLHSMKQSIVQAVRNALREKGFAKPFCSVRPSIPRRSLWRNLERLTSAQKPEFQTKSFIIRPAMSPAGSRSCAMIASFLFMLQHKRKERPTISLTELLVPNKLARRPCIARAPFSWLASAQLRRNRKSRLSI